MSKFDFTKLSTLLISSFLIELTFFEENEHFFHNVESTWEVQIVKGKFRDNPGYNVLELYNVLEQARFAVKRNLISSITKLPYKLALELTHDLRLRILQARSQGEV